ncbi:MAG: DUF2202 domain-containing protein [Gemmatimonadota bacterium]
MNVRSMARIAVMSVLLGGLWACGDSKQDLLGPDVADAELTTMLVSAIQDEYHAENVYLRVLADFGNVAPFANIVNAEERHSAAVTVLFQNRGLEAPDSEWNSGNVPTFASIAAACEGAYQAEISNIEMYDEFLSAALPLDVTTVFENNRAASLDRHMPAFLACK